MYLLGKPMCLCVTYATRLSHYQEDYLYENKTKQDHNKTVFHSPEVMPGMKHKPFNQSNSLNIPGIIVIFMCNSRPKKKNVYTEALKWP